MPAPVETLTKEPPPAELVDDSACQADDDCVLAYEPCGYHRNPCRDSWKRAINREANRQWEEAWQYRKPDCSAVASCEVPSGKWLGTEARCIDGQCKAR